MKNKCFLCGCVITSENDTKEHIIPNAIGGRKKISGFICITCNSKSGDDWDSELAKNMNPLSLFFGISRDRGDVPSQIFETTGGDRLAVHHKGSMGLEKPTFEEFPIEAGVQIKISARSKSEAKKMLTGVKRKYPQVDIEDLLDNAKEVSFYSPDMIKFSLTFGGQKAGRSIVKSALSMVFSSGIDPSICEHAINYLKDENGSACFGYFYDRDLILNRPSDLIFHCVAVQGDPKNGMIVAYIELFSVQRMIMCLSNSYCGHQFKSCYSIDPVSGKELDIDVNLSVTHEEISNSYKYKAIPEGSVEDAFSRVIPIGMKASYDKEKNRVINEAVAYAFKNCGAKEGELLQDEHIRKLTDSMMEKLQPFIIHQIARSKNKGKI